MRALKRGARCECSPAIISTSRRPARSRSCSTGSRPTRWSPMTRTTHRPPCAGHWNRAWSSREAARAHASFHPKSWRFERRAFGIAFVGSSNLSRLGARTPASNGISGLPPDRDPTPIERLRRRVRGLWARARALDAAWIADMPSGATRRSRSHPAKSRPKRSSRRPSPMMCSSKPSRAARCPRGGPQARARRAGDGSRQDVARHARLSAAARGTRPPTRVCSSWRIAASSCARRPRTTAGSLPSAIHVAHRLVHRGAASLAADLVFASVAKLSRPEHLERLREAASSTTSSSTRCTTPPRTRYRAHPGAPRPRVPAGPHRDARARRRGDVLGLFDDHVAYRADMGEGIARRAARPFHYFGVKDDIDYENIPWRNRRFDPELARRGGADRGAHADGCGGRGRSIPASARWCSAAVAHANYVARGCATGRAGRRGLLGSGLAMTATHSLRQLARGRARRGVRRRPVQRGRRCAAHRSGGDAAAHGVERGVPPAARPRPARERGKGSRSPSSTSSATTGCSWTGCARCWRCGRQSPVAARLPRGGTGPELPPGCSVELELEAKELLASFFRGTQRRSSARTGSCGMRGGTAHGGRAVPDGLPARDTSRGLRGLVWLRGPEEDLTAEEARAWNRAGRGSRSWKPRR